MGKEHAHPAADGRGGQGSPEFGRKTRYKCGLQGTGQRNDRRHNARVRAYSLALSRISRRNKSRGRPATALQQVEYTLEDLLAGMCDSEEKLKEYFATLHDRAVQTWQRQRAAA